MSTTQSHIFEAPKIRAPKIEQEDKWLREERAFFSQLPQLLKKWRGKWVAIHEEQVIETGDSLHGVLLIVRNRLPGVEVYIQYVDEKLPVAKMLSPRDGRVSCVSNRISAL